ncbi:MAG TPA: YCF48-related protein [Pyrinomonadaceae bacterium]|nr:YCF48-related protein [Pyrinomonadaceae bacterium]
MNDEVMNHARPEPEARSRKQKSGATTKSVEALSLRASCRGFSTRRSSLCFNSSLITHHSSLLSHSSLLFCALALLLLLGQVGAARGECAWSSQRSKTMAWLHAVYFLDLNRGWAVGSSGALLSTTDGGASWNVMHRPTEDTLRDLYFSDEQTGWLVCERNIYKLKTVDEPRTYLMNTTDGGATWKLVNVIGKEVDARLVRALFTGGDRAWAFGENGALYTTHDGGANWQRQRVPTRHLLLGGAFLDQNQGWLVGAGATILQTTDGGETWRTDLIEMPGVRLTSASFVDKSHGWAVGTAGQVFVTMNGGRTWRAQVSNVEADLLDVKFLNETEGWAAGSEGTIIHTTDAGGHWTVVPSGTTHPLERLCFVSRTRGWAVGFGGTIIAYAPASSPPAPELKGQK